MNVENYIFLSKTQKSIKKLHDEDFDESELATDLSYHYDYSDANAKRYAKYAINWIEKEKAKLVERIEKIFRDYTDPLVVTARFSNGETIYESESNRKAVLKAAVA